METIISGILAVAGGVFGFLKMKKAQLYIKFVDQLDDIYFKYLEITKDGKITNKEKAEFADEILEALEAGRSILDRPADNKDS